MMLCRLNSSKEKRMKKYVCLNKSCIKKQIICILNLYLSMWLRHQSFEHKRKRKNIIQFKMKGFVMFVLALACAHEMLVTKEYTDYLKKHVSWGVMEYEDNIFRGWTVDEIKAILLKDIPSEGYIPEMEPEENLPTSINWENAKCDYEIRNQGNCGSCWAFAIVGMLSSRCCLLVKDYGMLSVQELISCDSRNHGCRGGWCTWAMEYIKSAGGLVPESCLPCTLR
eukprot:TRINITY_DN2402_c0_g1_i3.p1 TRINITY_DN2402_c0_g1~~TRINITY_DN2402_c0_g1_i3.p1  ORF type:complete len:225 (+),score=26.75 TRINITY_DN2402_c0_g1_i3:389-1063(+)